MGPEGGCLGLGGHSCNGPQAAAWAREGAGGSSSKEDEATAAAVSTAHETSALLWIHPRSTSTTM